MNITVKASVGNVLYTFRSSSAAGLQEVVLVTSDYAKDNLCDVFFPINNCSVGLRELQNEPAGTDPSDYHGQFDLLRVDGYYEFTLRDNISPLKAILRLKLDLSDAKETETSVVTVNLYKND